MSERAIVLDANILIRAVLGHRVRELISVNAEKIKFYAPDVAYKDARKYLPELLKKRKVFSRSSIEVLDGVAMIVRSVNEDFYGDMQHQAMQRISMRDADDWPVLACAMTLGCPVWTEDADFFGTGIATWTTDRIALYFD
jgi:predicted nucleic acid-binding protein